MKRHSSVSTKKSQSGVVPAPRAGTGLIAFLQAGAKQAAAAIAPAQANLLLMILVFALWLAVAKCRLKHREVGPFISLLLKQFPSLPTRAELDLWVRMTMKVLHKYGHLPSPDPKYYRRHPEQMLIELLVALRRRVEESPDLISDSIRDEFQKIQELVVVAKKSTRTGRPKAISARRTDGGRREKQLKNPKQKESKK